MKKISRQFVAIMAVLAMFINGCNAFEAIDSNLADKTVSDRIENGNYAMDSGDYSKALDIFTALAEEGNNSDAVFRGKAQAEAGKAGFKLLKMLNSIQNALTSSGGSESLFTSLNSINDYSLLNTALADASKISNPTSEDKLMASFLALNIVCHRLVEKYDTNFNGKLEANDQIDFDTNDAKTDKWAQIFADLSKSSSNQSIEQAFVNAAEALNGRGTPWTLVSPIEGRKISGKYTPANRLTIIAIGDLADRLELANEYFEKDESRFKDTIVRIDGNGS